jgi:4-diphosphocytidyl-2-C-methyl-D-erythritol kinase
MLVLNSYAKINLCLRVGPPRPDGFHGLVSWFCAVGLADEVEFTQIFASAGRTTTISCDNPEVPCDGRNLVLKAATSLCGADHSPVHIHLRKRIPMGSGLGGGSSNAATTLRGLQQIWGIRLSPEREMEIAASLGSDVPFFLCQPSAICRGRGEQVSRTALPMAQAAVLLLPPITMPTPAVYRKFDEMELGTDLESADAQPPAPELPTMELLGLLRNDLESPAFAIAPELAALRGSAERIAGRPVRMSGSGSALFTLYDSQAQAREASAVLREALGITCVACSLGRCVS